MQGGGGRRRVWEEKGRGKLKLGGAQEDAGSEGDGEIRRTERDREEGNQAGVCGGRWGRKKEDGSWRWV